jgi:hypothetical protein
LLEDPAVHSRTITQFLLLKHKASIPEV